MVHTYYLCLYWVVLQRLPFFFIFDSKLMATTTTNTTATMIEPLLPCLESTGKPIPIEDEKEEEPMSATTSLLKYMV